MKDLDMAVLKTAPVAIDRAKPGAERTVIRIDRDPSLPAPRRGITCDCKNTKLDDSGFCVNCGGETI